MLDTSDMGTTWPEFKKKSVELDKEAKKESREFELWLLERRSDSKFDRELMDDMIELEKEHRRNLDQRAERRRKELMEMKGGQDDN